MSCTKKNYLKEKLDSIATTKTVKNDNVYEKIKQLSKNERVLMLNEMHWSPKHRLMAQKLLKPLKENGYNHFAVEGINIEKDSILNVRKYPIRSTGHYTSEPYFGHLLREAIKLDYKIIGYDDFETENRELTQAKNIKKIINSDSTAKVFVYAGIDHILEGKRKESSIKRMATYFKEISGIDPLTINQTDLVADNNDELILLQSNQLKNIERVNAKVDYFLINNIKPSLKQIFQEKEFLEISIEIKKLLKYKTQEVFLSIYYTNEYEKFKSNAVPIINRIFTVNNSKVELYLPKGGYFLKIQSKENDLIFLTKINL